MTDAGGKVLTDSATVTRGAAIDVRLARGGLAATVDAVKSAERVSHRYTPERTQRELDRDRTARRSDLGAASCISAQGPALRLEA